MSEPFLAEIRIWGFNWAPKDWAQCDGQQMPINQNQALFSLLGTNFGGDGRVHFDLPDLRGRTPVSRGDYIRYAEKAGLEAVVLTDETMPAHSHQLLASSQVNDIDDPVGNMFPTVAVGSDDKLYSDDAQGLTTNLGAAVGSVGSGNPHYNMQPYLVLNFTIATSGLYPSRS